MKKVHLHRDKNRKHHSESTQSDSIFELGVLNRRALLKRSFYLPMVSILAACRYGSNNEKKVDSAAPENTEQFGSRNLFNTKETLVLQSVQQLLLPDDGDGPDAKAIQAFDYLNFAMTDQQNIEDGDLEYIKNGVSRLSDLSARTHGEDFLDLSTTRQELLLRRIADSAAGEDWLSLLMYYLMDALLLDPIYGGNPDEVGWKWLGHQAGYPRPVAGKTYRDFNEPIASINSYSHENQPSSH